MNQKRLVTMITVTAATAAVTGVVLFQMLASDSLAVVQAADEPAATTSTTTNAVRVEVAEPQRRTLTRELRLPADLRAYESVDLYAKTSGYINVLNVDIGSRVRKGDKLIEIDVPEMIDELRQAEAVLAAKRANAEALRAKAEQAALMVETARAVARGAEAEHELSRITFQRKDELHKGQVIPAQEFDEAQSKLHITEAQVRIAEARIAGAQGAEKATRADVSVAESEINVAEATVARLKTLMAYTTITAPYDGVITQRMVDHGDFVRSAAEGETTYLLTLVRDDLIRLTLAIPESDASYVRVGTPVQVRVKSLGSTLIEAEVSRTAAALRSDLRTMQVEVDLDNADGRLAPGMYAHAVVMLEAKEQAMVIPSKAIRVRGSDLSVLVANNDVARTLPITIGYDDGIQAEVLSGLEGDERIIVSASGVVAPGVPVQATLASRQR